MMASGDISEEWLYQKGILECFLILIELENQLSLNEKQEISRLVSMMTMSDEMSSSHFEPFVEVLSEWQYSQDSLLASNAVKSLIHIHNHSICCYPDGIHLFNVHTAISKINSGSNYGISFLN